MKKRVVALLLSLTVCMTTVLSTSAAEFGSFSGSTSTVSGFGDLPSGIEGDNSFSGTDTDLETPETPETPDEVPATPIVTPTVTPTVTPEITVTPTVTPEVSVTPTVTPEITVTPTVTPEISITPTVTPEVSVTPTVTPTVTPEAVKKPMHATVPLVKGGVIQVKEADWVSKDGKFMLRKATDETVKPEEEFTEVLPEEVDVLLPAEGDSEGADAYFTREDGLLHIETVNDNNGVHKGYYLFDESGYLITGYYNFEPVGKEYIFEDETTAVLYEECAGRPVTPATSNLGQTKRDYWNWDKNVFQYYGKEEGARVPIAELNKQNKAGYFKINDNYYCLDDTGKPVTGDVKIQGALYHFKKADKTAAIPGAMHTGWLKDTVNKKERWRYFEEDAQKATFGQWLSGARATQLDTQVMGKSKYLIDKNGYLVKNAMLKADDGYTYAGNAKGQIYIRKPVVFSGSTYYFQEDGRRVENEMVLYNKNYYFMQKNGKRADNMMITYKGKTYYFNSGGRRVANKVVPYKGATYFFQKDGTRLENSPLTWNGHVYFLKKDGKRAENCVINWKGYTYFMQKNGRRLENSMLKWNGHMYFLQKNGRRADNMLIKYGKYRYYFGPGGRLVNWKNSWQRCPGVGNRAYYFGSVPGRVVEKTGWQKVLNNKTGGFYGWFYFSKGGNCYMDVLKNGYYLKADGRLASGRTVVGGRTYFFEKSSTTVRRGKMYTNKLFTDGGKIYYAQQNGTLFNGGWKKIGGNWYYFQKDFTAATNRYAKRGSINGYMDSLGRFTTGWVIINDAKNQVRYLDPDNYGKYLKNCSRWIDGKLYYFDSKGFRMSDVSSKYTGSRPYYLEVDRVNGVMTVYTGSDKKIPIKTIRVSVGTASTPTPTGPGYRLTPYSRWQPLMGPSWGQYGTHVDGAGYGGIFIHSVAGSAPNSYSLPAAEYNRLGNPASHGCIRACVADAKWVYQNCGGGTVRIFDGKYNANETFKGPLGRKPLVPLKSPYNYDPTDPAI